MSDNGERQRSDVASGSDDEDEYSIYFQNQTQLDNCLQDVASMVGICMKNDDHACEKEGAVIGKLTFTYDEERIDCMEVGIEGKGLSDLAARLFVKKLLMRRKLCWDFRSN
ncbi:DNA topoisomerase 6 subunit A3 [Tanacetum coccineum]